MIPSVWLPRKQKIVPRTVLCSGARVLIFKHFRGILDDVEAFKGGAGEYLKNLSKRSKVSRAYSAHQSVGLELAGILNDAAHKALYIRLAKKYTDHHSLMILAKDVASKPSVQNKGAYFMRLLHGEKKTTETKNGTKNTPDTQ